MSVPQDQLRWENYRGISNIYESQTAPASRDQPDDVEWADYGKSIMSGLASIVGGVGFAATALGSEEFGPFIRDLGNDAVDYWHDSMSDPYKAELAKEFVRKSDDGSGLFGFEWGDASLTTVFGAAAESLGPSAIGMGAGAGIAKVLQLFANPVGRGLLTNTLKEAGVRLGLKGKNVVGQVRLLAKANPGKLLAGELQAAKKLAVTDNFLGAAGFGAGEGLIGGMSTGSQVYSQIMSLPAETLLNNERYKQIYDSTDSSISELERHYYAANTVAMEAGTAAGWQAGITTALLGAPMGMYWGRLLGGAKLSSTLTRGVATGAAGEAGQEFAQSGFEQYISNIRTQPFDPSIDDFDGVLNAAIGGFLAGGLLGGAMGPVSVGPAKMELAIEKLAKKNAAQGVRDKIGGELQTSARNAAKAGADETTIMEIVHDAVEQRVPTAAAIENLESLTKEKQTGEKPAAKAAPPVIPDDTERKKLAPAELSDMMETIAGGPIEVETVNPVTLQVDAELMQFKQQTDEQGVTGALKGVTQFEQIKAGLAIVWERLDKVRFIVDGHQRVNLAKLAIEAGQDPATVRMQAVILREADGVSPELARDIAALKNIGEGTGSPIDAAQVMRDMGPAGEAAIARLPQNQTLVKQGKGLAKLDEEAFGKAVNEVIEPAYAAAVGDMIADGPLQNAAIDVLQKTEPANITQARAIIDQVRTTGTEEVITEDLFGATAVVESLYLERAQVLDSAQRLARRDKATFKTLTKREGKITGTGKNKLDRAANKAKIGEADQALAILSAAANTKGPVSDALTEAARQVKAGKKPGAVAGAFLDKVVSSITGRGKAGTKAGRSKPKAKRKVSKAAPREPTRLVPTLGSSGQALTYDGDKFEISVSQKFNHDDYSVDVSVADSSTTTGFLYDNDLSKNFDTLEEAKAYAETIAAKDTAPAARVEQPTPITERPSTPEELLETLEGRADYLESPGIITGLKAPRTRAELRTLMDQVETIDRLSPEGRYLKAQGLARDVQYKGAKNFAGLSAFGDDVAGLLATPVEDVVTGENLVAGEQGLYLVEQATDGRSPEVAAGESVTTEAPTSETLFSRKKDKQPCGKCFENTGRYMMLNGGSDPNLVLVHGYVTGQGPIEGVRFAHSWIERRSSEPVEGAEGVNMSEKDRESLTRVAMDMTTDERYDNPIEVPAFLYRAVGHAEVLFEYSYDEVMKKLASSHHFGPWDFEETAEAESLYSRKYSTPKTAAMRNFLEKESDRVTGLSIEADGVFIYTDSAKWSDDHGAGTFRADSETAAIKKFYESVQPVAALSSRKGGTQQDAFTNDAEAQLHKQEIADEIARRDAERNTGQEGADIGAVDDMFSTAKNQQDLFSRPLDEVMLTREYEVDGAIYDVERPASVLLRQHDKRTRKVRELRTCIRA